MIKNDFRLLILRLRDRAGVTAIVVAILIVMLLGFVALAVDIGYVMVTKNELQNVADAAALGATRQLGAIYEPMSYAQQQSYVCDPATIIPVARDVASKNQAGGINITVNDADVIIGTWDAKTKILNPTLNQPDAVRVIARRDGSANGPLTTFFARIFGTDTVDVSAKATAALTAQSSIDKDKVIPVGISQYWFDKPFCNQFLKFYPTNNDEGCAGWNTYGDWPASESYLRKTILEGWTNGTFSPPGANINDEFVFIGGTLGDQTFNAFNDLYNSKKDNNGNWTTHVVVYDATDCKNPSGMIKIVGFATAIIYRVDPPPDKIIWAEVICNDTVFGRGSGGEYGTKGSIPGLVQ